MASVPYFKLPRMHKILKERGHVPTPLSYFEVIHTLSSKQDLTN